MTEYSEELYRLAAVELAHARLIGLLPDRFEGASIEPNATPVFDINGEELFYRVPIMGKDGSDGYVDIGVHPAFGETLLAVSPDARWDEEKLRRAAYSAAREHATEALPLAEMRFVAYSYPKLAVQFLVEDKEVLMLELISWEPVPELDTARRERDEPPGYFERWSMVDEMPGDVRSENTDRFRSHIESVLDLAKEREADLSLEVISLEAARRAFKVPKPIPLYPLYWSREVHYSTRNSDHHPCYELRSQLTGVWCVAASVQMVLDFYRYEYSQIRIADELGVGTCKKPNGLPYSQDHKVVDVLEKLTSNALDAHMNKSPSYGEFTSEIKQNRPLVSFIPGHARTVAGYLRSLLTVLGKRPFRGLLVYDPWPPSTCAHGPVNGGTITRWENYNTQTYRRTFTARVKLV